MSKDIPNVTHPCIIGNGKKKKEQIKDFLKRRIATTWLDRGREIKVGGPAEQKNKIIRSADLIMVPSSAKRPRRRLERVYRGRHDGHKFAVSAVSVLSHHRSPSY